MENGRKEEEKGRKKGYRRKIKLENYPYFDSLFNIDPYVRKIKFCKKQGRI